MAETPARRITLADLVAVVILCGAAIGAFLAARPGPEGRNPFLLLIVAVIGWIALRSRLAAPACEECGRRFNPTPTKPAEVRCPRCDEPQAGLVVAYRRRTRLFWAMTPVVAIGLIVVIAATTDAGRGGGRMARGPTVGVLIGAGLVLAGMLGLAGFGAARARLARPRDRLCEWCGGEIPAKPAEPTICPNCQGRKLGRERAGEQQARQARDVRWTLILIVIGLVAIVPTIGGGMLRSGRWGSLVLLLLPLVGVGFLAWTMLVFLRRSGRLRSLLTDEGLLARARECAGAEVTVARDGPLTIVWSGPDDPGPLLREAFAASHRRLERCVGEADVADPPIRVVAFHDVDALRRFYRSSFPGLDIEEHLGLYLQRPWGLAMLCVGQVPGRLDDPGSLAASVYGLVLVEQAFGVLPLPWIQAGLARALSAHGDRAEAVRRDRRLAAALSGGTAWSEEILSPSVDQRIAKRLRRRADMPSRLKDALYLDQCWSMLDYLAGEAAPEARRAAFRAFLKDAGSRAAPEVSFFRHFGHGFGSLVEGWREWVRGPAAGDDDPTPDVRAALLDRVLPVIRDRSAPRRDRVDAIRDWRKVGTELGVVDVIDLLRDPGEIPREEVVLALCMASGTVGDDDPEAWRARWGQIGVGRAD